MLKNYICVIPENGVPKWARLGTSTKFQVMEMVLNPALTMLTTHTNTQSVIVFRSLESYCPIHQPAVRYDLQLEKERERQKETDRGISQVTKRD